MKIVKLLFSAHVNPARASMSRPHPPSSCVVDIPMSLSFISTHCLALHLGVVTEAQTGADTTSLKVRTVTELGRLHIPASDAVDEKALRIAFRNTSFRKGSSPMGISPRPSFISWTEKFSIAYVKRLSSRRRTHGGSVYAVDRT